MTHTKTAFSNFSLNQRKPGVSDSNSSRVHPKKSDSSYPSKNNENNNNERNNNERNNNERNNNGDFSNAAENTKSVQVKMIYPQPAQIQQRVLLPEPPITTDLQTLNQTLIRTLNETKSMKDQMETDRRMNELKEENRELRQSNQTTLMAQLLQRQQQPVTNPVPPTIILNVAPSPSRSSSALSRSVTSALTKVYSLANGQSNGQSSLVGEHRAAVMDGQRSHDARGLETSVRLRRAITSFEDPSNNRLEDITDYDDDDDDDNDDDDGKGQSGIGNDGISERVGDGNDAQLDSSIEWTGNRNEIGVRRVGESNGGQRNQGLTADESRIELKANDSVTDQGWKNEKGGWRNEGGGWKNEGGGWKNEKGGQEEEGKKIGETFTMWKSRDLNLNPESIVHHEEEISSISGQLDSKKRMKRGGERRSVSIDVHGGGSQNDDSHQRPMFLFEKKEQMKESDLNRDVERGMNRDFEREMNRDVERGEVNRSRSFVTPDFGNYRNSNPDESYKPYFAILGSSDE